MSLAGSAGGQEATPPTDRATAILLGLNGATERDSLSNLFPLDNAEGKLSALHLLPAVVGSGPVLGSLLLPVLPGWEPYPFRIQV